jgi:ectoine hydroxylase-related dioxygenase (phytanoyl-CoA dioxygenase family)
MPNTMSQTKSEWCETSAGAAADLLDRGFFVIKELLDEQTRNEALELLPKLIDEDVKKWGGNKYYTDHGIAFNLMFRGDVFRRIMTNDGIIRVLNEVMGPTSILNAYNAPSTPPQGTNNAVVVHTDCPPERIVPDYITNLNLVLALSPFTKDKGATFYYPGSHRIEKRPSDEEFYAHAVQVELEPGDVVFFNARVWHAAGVNRTSEARYGVGMNFIRSFMRQRFDFPRMSSPEFISGLSALERRLLGFNVRVPANLEEFYVAPEERLYLSGQG